MRAYSVFDCNCAFEMIRKANIKKKKNNNKHQHAIGGINQVSFRKPSFESKFCSKVWFLQSRILIFFFEIQFFDNNTVEHVSIIHAPFARERLALSGFSRRRNLIRAAVQRFVERHLLVRLAHASLLRLACSSFPSASASGRFFRQVKAKMIGERSDQSSRYRGNRPNQRDRFNVHAMQSNSEYARCGKLGTKNRSRKLASSWRKQVTPCPFCESST